MFVPIYYFLIFSADVGFPLDSHTFHVCRHVALPVFLIHLKNGVTWHAMSMNNIEKGVCNGMATEPNLYDFTYDRSIKLSKVNQQSKIKGNTLYNPLFTME